MKLILDWNICRTCLQEANLRSIHELDERNVRLKTKIEMCSGIRIDCPKQEFNLPEQICEKCAYYLNVSYKFRLMCRKADERLKTVLRTKVKPALKKAAAKQEIKDDVDFDLKIQPLEHDDFNKFDMKTEDINFKKEPEEDLVTPLIYMRDFNNDDNNHLDNDDNNVNEINDVDQDYDALDLNLENDDVENPDTEDIKLKYRLSFKDEEPPGECYSGSLMKERTDEEIKPKIAFALKKIRQTNSTTQSLVCETCGNIFTKRYQLTRHIRLHRGEKKYSCEICGKDCGVSSGRLKAHMRTHTGEKPFLCHYCGRAFSDYSTRIKHIRTHTGERPFKCETCGRSFATGFVLSKHQVVHTGNRPFECKICSSRFATDYQLKQHERSIKHKTAVVKSEQGTVFEEDEPIIAVTTEDVNAILENYQPNP